MAGLTLVTGRAGSGKTERLLRAASERYAADPFAPVLVLVPTARHADQFRRRLVHGGRVAFGLDVIPLGMFARRHARGLASTDVTTELLHRVTDERIRTGGPAGRFAPIAHTPGLHRLVGQAIGDLVMERVTPDAVTEASRRTGDADLMALAEIYAAYHEALAARGWTDGREAAARAAAGLADTPPAVLDVPGLVLVDGVQFLRAGEVELVAALAARADVLVTLDTDSGERAAWTAEALLTRVPGSGLESLADRQVAERTVEAASAADAESQIREIARSIKMRLASDATLRPSDFAVTFRQVTPHLSLARRVFAEFALPLDPAAGERVAHRPLGVWLLRLLRLPGRGWRVTHLADGLRSGFLDRRRWGVQGDTPDLLAQVARGHQLWGSREALDSLAAALEAETADASEAYAERLRATRAALLALLPDLDAWFGTGQRRTPGEHAAILDTALFGQDGIARTAVDDYSGLDSDIRALRGELNALRLVDEAIEPVPTGFTEFVEALADRLDRPSTLLREPGGVLLAPMHTLHGLRFRYVYIGGLAEGEFPAPRGAAQLLDEHRRARLAESGLPLPPAARATEDELWQTAESRAETLTSLWRPRLDGSGRPVAASYYFGAGAAAGGVEPAEVSAETPPEVTASRPELAVALARGWPRGEHRRPAGLASWDVVRRAAPVEADRRSYTSAGRYEGVLRPDAGVTHPALARLLGAEGRWSASRVDAYRTCPFQFFASYALHLAEVDEEKASADAATRGTVIHDILEAAVLPLVERALPLDRSTIEDVVARLREQGPRIWDAAPRTYAFGRAALWRYERDDALDQVEALLRAEAAAWPPYLDRVGALETEHTVTVPGIEPALQMYAGIDRLDLGAGVARIVDYKTGKTIPEKEVRNGDRVQLPWYAEGARLAYPDVDRVVAKYVYLKPTTDPWDLDSERAGDVQILDGAVQIALAVRSAAGSGRFEVGPRVDVCPTYCSYQHICRVGHTSRWKAWTEDLDEERGTQSEGGAP